MKKGIIILSAVMLMSATPEMSAKMNRKPAMAKGVNVATTFEAKKPAKVKVQEAPKGERKYYVNDNFYFYPLTSGVGYVQNDELAMELIFDGEDVYMKDPFGGQPTRTYLHGTIDRDHSQIVFEFPQEIFTQDGIVYYASCLDAKYTEKPGGYSMTYVMPEEINEYRLTMNADGTIESVYMGAEDAYPDQIIGMVTEDGKWLGVGDGNFYMYPYRAKAPRAVLPEGIESNKVVLEFDGGDGGIIDWAEKGDDVYIGNIAVCTNNWLHAKKQDGKLLLDGLQFLGTADGYWLYLSALPVVKTYEGDDFYYDYPTCDNLTDDDPMPWLEEIVFDYNEETGVYKNSTDALLLDLTELESFYPVVLMVYPEIRKMAENPVWGAPMTPYISMSHEYDAAINFGDFYFDLPKFDVNGNYMNLDDLYYEVYFDGQLKTFEYPEYQNVLEPMTKIPYSFNDMWDIQTAGEIEHLMAYYQPADKIEIYLYHNAPNGETYKSAPGVWEAAGVDALNAESATAVQYYDLQGRRVARPEKGLFIRKAGSKVEKVIK